MLSMPPNHLYHMPEHQASHLALGIYRVAVITATFNAAQHIMSCIKSVESQTHPNVFHVIVDGKSDDQTINIVSRSQSERLLFISEPDNGIYSAWNKGIGLINADWYLFLGSDDILFPNAIQTLLEQSLASNSINLVTAKAMLLSDHGAFAGILGGPFSRKVLWHHMPIANSSTIYHKRLFSDSFPYNEALKSAADYSFLIKQRKSIVASHFSGVVSCMKLGGVSNKKPILSIIESYQERLRYYSYPYHFFLLIFLCISLTKLALSIVFRIVKSET